MEGEDTQKEEGAVDADGPLDVIDKVMLTPVAVAQGRQWCDMVFGDNDFAVAFDCIPSAIFSIPVKLILVLSLCRGCSTSCVAPKICVHFKCTRIFQ